MDLGKKPEMNIKNLFDDFIAPKFDNFPGCYWFWQRIPSEEEIVEQTRQILDAGFKTAFIQPRISFPREKYLSKEYLSAYKFAAETASKYGLKLGLYDDYNWNSGHAGGRTTKFNPSASERHLFWSSTVIQSSSARCSVSGIRPIEKGLGGKFQRWTYVDGKPEWDHWQLVQVIAYQETDGFSDLSKMIDLTSRAEIRSNSKNGCEVVVDIPDTAYYGWKLTIFVTSQCITSRMINYVDPKAVESFIRYGYEPYKEIIGKYFGTTIFCLFMDHPHAGFYTWDEIIGEIKNSLQYHESLDEYFYEMNGYSLSMGLLSFMFSKGNLLEKARTDLFSTYGRFARENFLGQISAWAKNNSLQFAGHELFNFIGSWGFGGGFESYDLRTDFGADYFGIGVYKDISTVDASNSHPQISALMGNSISKADHKYGCMLEQYYWCEEEGLPGLLGNWDLKYEDYRAQAIRHTLFGAKTYICHGFYLTDHLDDGDSELGNPRFDFPPAVNYMQWFKYHDRFAKEISTLSSLIYNAKPLTKIALLYPLRSFWVNGDTGAQVADSEKWSELLLRHGYHFDVVDEDNLCLSGEGRILSGKCEYNLLILPGVTTLKSIDTFFLLKAFVENSGRIIFSGSVPNSFQIGDEKTQSIRSLFDDLINKSPNAYFSNLSGNYSDQLNFLEDIVGDAIPGYPEIKFDQSTEDIWSWLGNINNSYLFFFFNDSHNSANGSIKFSHASSHIEIWDMTTGEVYPWPWYEKEGRSLSISLHIKPNELLCFCVRDEVENEDALQIMENDFHSFGLSDEINEGYQFIAEKPGNYSITYKSKLQRSISIRGGEVIKKQKDGNVEKLTLSVQQLPQGISLGNDWLFRTPEMSKEISIDITQGWEKQGFNHYKGLGIYSCDFRMPEKYQLYHWLLLFPAIYCTAEITINDRDLGTLLYKPYELSIPNAYLTDHINNIVVAVRNTSGNYYYHHNPYGHIDKEPSGIIGAPGIKPIMKLEIS